MQFSFPSLNKDNTQYRHLKKLKNKNTSKLLDSVWFYFSNLIFGGLFSIFMKFKLWKIQNFPIWSQNEKFFFAKTLTTTRRTKQNPYCPIKIQTHFKFLHYSNITVHFQFAFQPNTHFQYSIIYNKKKSKSPTPTYYQTPLNLKLT